MKQFFNLVKKYRLWLLIFIVVAAILFSIFNRLTNRNTPTTSPSPRPSVSNPVQATVQPNYSTAPTSPLPSTQPTGTTNDPQPTVSNSLSTPILPTTINGSSTDLDESGTVLYYLDPYEQQFKSKNLETQEVTNLGPVPAYLELALWSPDHAKLFVLIRNIEGDQARNPLFRRDLEEGRELPALYNLKDQRLTALNPHIRSISFAGNDKIIYQFKDDRYNNLSIANTDGTNWKNLATLTENSSIGWSGNVALVHLMSSKQILTYDARGTKIKTQPMPPDLSTARVFWTNNGQDALYWNQEGDQVVINRLKSDGTTERSLSAFNDNDDFTILWDNKKGVVYLVTFESLTPIGTITP